MILQKDNDLIFSSEHTSLLFHVNEIKKVTLEYYGEKLRSIREIDSLIRKYPFNQGCSIDYSKEGKGLCLDHMKLISSSLGKGDFFSPSLLLKNKESTLFDFTFSSYEIKKEITPLNDLPFPHDMDQEIVLHLKEEKMNILLDIHYLVSEKEDVFAVYSQLTNCNAKELLVQKISSLQLPLVNENYEILSTYGCWAGELNIERHSLQPGKFVIESLCGSSSNRHNPFFLMKNKKADFFQGNVYGFNLMYSSNFENSIEMDAFEDVRVQVGISSTGFEKKMKTGEIFSTPVALMSYSSNGINSLSSQYHDFINRHVIPSAFAYKERPVAYNNWEATGMKFKKSKITSLMKKASRLGVELFVLDDGWFSTREDDSHGLGDWEVNERKLPGGLEKLSSEAKKYNLKFGIWMEPEMVNEDTKLYKEHPDYVIQDKFHSPSYGRNQLTLDLRKKEVQDYVYQCVSQVLKSADISYLKLDYNRNISDYDNRDGTFFYDYMIGLYSVLKRLRDEFPDVLFENCASGGNRFDLGMLSYFSQSWMSDDTDSYQRTLIQEGGLLGYPLSCLSNHVSCKTSNQMLRFTSFDNKFNTACFGVLGYELDLDDLSDVDIQNITRQISFYKEHRKVLQYGRVYQDAFYSMQDEKTMEAVLDDTAIVSIYQKIQKPNPRERHLLCYGLEKDSLYHYQTRKESIPLKKFGGLINYVTPFHINPEGVLISILSKKKEMEGEVDEGILSGKTFSTSGAVLSQEWSGVGFNENVRLMSDFGSRLYVIKKTED